MAATIESLGSSIIALGNFNPPIFSPDWLNKNGLIGDGDLEFAKSSPSLAVTPDICRFESEWFVLQVVADQFSLKSKGALTPLLKDLAMGIFTIVGLTPVRAVGLNFDANYKISTVEELHKIGDTLAPKNIWRTIYPENDHQSIGMANLTISIEQNSRNEKPTNDNKKNISVRRSVMTPNGVYFSFNDHYSFSQEDISKITSANFLVSRIDECWDDLKNEAQKVFEEIIRQALDVKD